MKQLYSSGILLLFLLVGLVSNAQIRYATGVVAFSSEYSPTSWSAAQTLGAPNTTGCGDINTAWASRTSDGQREFLELEFADPAPINRVYIHESLAPGAVDTVYVFNPGTQQYEKVYEATAIGGAPCPRRFAIILPQTSFPVSRIRIAINSQAVPGYNEIDAVGIALLNDGGVIGSNQEICASAAPALFENTDPAFNGNASVIYAWQDSTENGSWQDIASASSPTYQAPVLSRSTWYRRKATLAGTVVFSNVIKMNFHESGDPTVFPSNGWNFYVYQTNGIDLPNAVYKGYYFRSGLDFKTQDAWNNLSVPSTATGYQGCDVANDNFVLIAKRTGFPAGNYLLQVSFSNRFRIYINGTMIRELACCDGTISLGALDQSSLVEIRLLDIYSSSYLNAEFKVAELNGGDIGEPQTICYNDKPKAFVNNISAFGGAAPATITYQWQDSLANGNWQDILNATGNTFQANNLITATWFRRKAMDNAGGVAYSDIVKVGVAVRQGDSALYGNQAWNVYGFEGNDITLVNSDYRGVFTTTGNKFDTYLLFTQWGSPSDAQGYQGCPVDQDRFVMSARREGFPAGKYRLSISNVDDQVMVLLNNNEIYKGGCCTDLNIEQLDANSKLDIRLLETGYISRLIFELVRIDSAIADYSNNICQSYFFNSVKGDQWYDFTDATGKVIASINPNGNNLGYVGMYAKHFGLGTTNIPRNPKNNKRYLPRYFNFYSSAYPNNSFPSPVKLRLYYKNSELEDYKMATGQASLTRDELRITHYNGANEDCDMANNTDQGVMLNDALYKEYTSSGFYAEVETGSFSEFGAVGGTETLPVTLLQFRGNPVNNEVQLSWNTSQELNNKGFEILRSNDGLNFQKIGWVEGHGTTSQLQQYSFNDKAPAAGRNFYRLRQVDIDNNSKLSEILLVSTKQTLKLNIAPNPVDNILYVEMDEKSISSLKIVDIQGRIMWKSDGQRLSSVTAIPVQQLQKGIYLLELTDDQGKKQLQKFLKK
ncbi:MAG: T9SS type A sorting domain-containing protein [Chitinophagaceae bacterium]|nr:T9SS type A sorting domain-containing protein [Chitinophagaceae bacterium]